MLILVPDLHSLVGTAASRTVAQLEELGVTAIDRQITVAVALDPSASPGRLLLATTLTDMLLRLDPLVGAVVIDAAGSDETAIARELGQRLPLHAEASSPRPDYVVGVGRVTGSCDLTVDAAGWVAAVGTVLDLEDDGNPIGPLACAALTAAEVFKSAFSTLYPERPLELEPWTGAFSFFSYDLDNASPVIADVPLDATLVGVGGVGAGFVRAIAALGDRVSGTLRLVDADRLTTDNLNRVSFASLNAALQGAAKATEAKTFLERHCPRLHVTAHQMDFGTYKQQLGHREERKYDAIVTGLDNDDARWEVQRELPRILIDGATGNDMVARVERVEFARYGCLGCSRPPTAVDDSAPVNCDAPPDPHAPSLSFLSSFPGILAAGELIKEVTVAGALRGRFDHVFRYGPNPDMKSTPGFRPDCPVNCTKPSKIEQYERKYASH